MKAYGLSVFVANFGCGSNRGGSYIKGNKVGGADYYLARTDNRSSDRQGHGYARVSSPQPSGAWEPAAAALSEENERVVQWVGVGWYAVVHFGGCSEQKFLLASQDEGSDSNISALCPAGMHPRGQDGFYVIGRSTGRTLSSLSTSAKARAADEYWCRSDIRYRIAYTAKEHSGHDPPPGVTVADDGDIFYAFGRSGCFYTAMSMSAGECEYAFPVPRCDDSGTSRDFSETELDRHTIGAKFSPEDDGTTDCGGQAPALPSFSDDPCVTVTLGVYENRPAGEKAEPGVPSSDRTLPAAAGRAAWNLGIASPHPQTAFSPPMTSNRSLERRTRQTC